MEFAPEQLASRILVVDDVASARKVVRCLLDKLGFKNVEEASDGAQAYERIVKGGIDIVVSDWVMPGLDGLELLCKIRGELGDRELSFLMITASSEREQVLHAANSGVTDYIVKPFGLATLGSKLQELFAREKKKGGVNDAS